MARLYSPHEYSSEIPPINIILPIELPSSKVPIPAPRRRTRPDGLACCHTPSAWLPTGSECARGSAEQSDVRPPMTTMDELSREMAAAANACGVRLVLGPERYEGLVLFNWGGQRGLNEGGWCGRERKAEFKEAVLIDRLSRNSLFHHPTSKQVDDASPRDDSGDHGIFRLQDFTGVVTLTASPPITSPRRTPLRALTGKTNTSLVICVPGVWTCPPMTYIAASDGTYTA